MKRLATFFLDAAFTLALFVFIAIYYNVQRRPTELICKTDTVTVYDTIPFYETVPVDSTVINYVTKLLPVAQKDSTKHDTVYVYVNVPIIQKEYKDSLYHAWVSGYLPSLDSITVFTPRQVITSVRTPERKRWGLGVQLGVGYSAEKFSPYIGVGVQYNLFGW